jgi:light-regulated signal transduction histidine kinase (bacteriophytochrome)
MMKPEISPTSRFEEDERWLEQVPHQSRTEFGVPGIDILPPDRARRDPRMARVRHQNALRSRRYTPTRPAYARTARSDWQLVDAYSIIDSIVELLPVPSGIKITLDVESTPFLAARAALETVLYELIGNAIAHHDRGNGVVSIGLETEGEFHLFTISDDGPGIMPMLLQDLAALNDEPAIAEESEAVGGLGLCARLVDRHGAKIILDIRPRQRGTIVRLLWPQFQRVLDA